MKFSFTVDGPPVSWKRARTNKGRHYTDPAQRAYMDRLAWAALAARPIGWDVTVRMRVSIVVTTETKRRSDLDRFCNVVGDALEGVAWDDDSQIDEWHAIRTVPAKGAGRMVVTVEGLDAE